MWLCYTLFNAHFLLYGFFLAADLLLVVYFIFILDYGNDVRQKANSSNFLEFKVGCKAAETMHLAQELLMNIQCSGGWRSFAKEMRPLKMRSVVEVDNNHLRATIEADPLTTTWKLPNNSTPTILRSFSIWSKLERWKSSISGCLMSWLKIKKYHCFEVSSSLILCNNKEPFIYQIVSCDEKRILYNNQQWPAQWLD